MSPARTLIVASKLARPRLPRIVDRRRLVEGLLNRLPDHPLTVVSAAAGYGKTTLLAACAAEMRDRFVWYSLGPEDADLQVFAAHLAAALRHRHSHYGRSLRGQLRDSSAAPPKAEVLAAATLNDFGRIRDPLLIILDDLHHVTGNPELVRYLSIVVENNQGPVRLIVASRTEPPLPLGRLRGRQQVSELGTSDLAFNRGELKTLLNDLHSRDSSYEEIDALLRVTEGWVTPIHLALQAGHGADLSRTLTAVLRTDTALHDYLAGEMLLSQDEETRRWMVRLAPFDVLEPSVLLAVFETGTIEARLRDLAQRNLLQVYEDQDRLVFRYHTLLREFLLRRFAAEVPPQEAERLHEAAVRVYVERGDLIRAAEHTARRGQPEVLAAFLETNALALLDQGHYQALLGLLLQLPAACLEAHPWLRLRLGDCRHFLADWPGAELEYERAQLEFERRGDAEGGAWVVLGLGRIWNLRGQSEKAARAGEAVLADRKARCGRELTRRLAAVVSGAHFYCGRYAEALRWLDRMEELSRGDPSRQAAQSNNRAVILASLGDFPAAARQFNAALRRPGARHSPRAGLHLANLGLLLTRMGEFEKARGTLEEAAGAARRWQNRSHLLTALIAQAGLDYYRDAPERCLEHLREIETLNEVLQVPLVAAECQALKAQILTDSGQCGPAADAIQRAMHIYGGLGRNANWLLYRIQAAGIELKAGRSEIAHRALAELLPVAETFEAQFPRAVLLFHLGEAARQLDLPEAADHLEKSVAMSRELGYDAFLRNEMKRSFEPFTHLLSLGREAAYVTRLALGSGPADELRFLPLIENPDIPEPTLQVVLPVLGEIGGPAAHRTLSTSTALAGRAARPLAASLRAIERRYPELTAGRAPASGGLALCTLGRLSLRRGEAELEADAWKSQRAFSLFLCLALRGSPGMSRDALIETFWPGRQARLAEKNFHPTLSYARRALRSLTDGPIFTVRGGLYQIDPGLAIDVDARRFERLATETQRSRHSGDRLARAEEARLLYRGDFCSELTDAWVEETRTRLGHLYEMVLAVLADGYLEKSEHALALPVLRDLARRNPYQEETYAKLMSCHARLGDRESVESCYRELSRRLQRDLGVEPLPATKRVYQSLILGE